MDVNYGCECGKCIIPDIPAKLSKEFEILLYSAQLLGHDTHDIVYKEHHQSGYKILKETEHFLLETLE